MYTTQQDSAMSVLYEVIIFFDFSFFFVYHKKLHKTSITVLLACITLNFMDMSRPMGVINSGAHQVLDYVDPALDLRPCKHRNQLVVKRSLSCTHLCTCQKVQNDVSLTYLLATSRTLQKIDMPTEGEASA